MLRVSRQKIARILLAFAPALFSQMPLVHADDGHAGHAAVFAHVSCHSEVSVPERPVPGADHCLRAVSETGLSGFVAPTVPDAAASVFPYGHGAEPRVVPITEPRSRALSPPPNRRAAFALENRRRI